MHTKSVLQGLGVIFLLLSLLNFVWIIEFFTPCLKFLCIKPVASYIELPRLIELVVEIPYVVNQLIFQYLGSFGIFIFPLIKACVLAPILEEFECRYILVYLKGKCSKPKWYLAATISTFLFAFGHNALSLAGMSGPVTMAIVSCCLVNKTGSIKPSIALHSVYNFCITSLKMMH